MPSVYKFAARFEKAGMVGSHPVKSSPLRDHCLKFDERQRVGCITVDIDPENLGEKDGGSSEKAEIWIAASGCGDDQLSYIIPAKLGGRPEVQNVFPLSKDVNVDNVNAWKNAEEAVYDFLKSSENGQPGAKRYASLTFGFEYKSPLNHLRPSKFYYGFKMLSEDGSMAAEAHGEIVNINSLAEALKNEPKPSWNLLASM